MEENWQETSGRGIGLGKKFELKIKRLGNGKGEPWCQNFFDGFWKKCLGDNRRGEESRNEKART